MKCKVSEGEETKDIEESLWEGEEAEEAEEDDDDGDWSAMGGPGVYRVHRVRVQPEAPCPPAEEYDPGEEGGALHPVGRPAAQDHPNLCNHTIISCNYQ